MHLQGSLKLLGLGFVNSRLLLDHFKVGVHVVDLVQDFGLSDLGELVNYAHLLLEVFLMGCLLVNFLHLVVAVVNSATELIQP